MEKQKEEEIREKMKEEGTLQKVALDESQESLEKWKELCNEEGEMNLKKL